MIFTFTNHTRFDVYQLWCDVRAALETLEVPPGGTFAAVSEPDRDARRRAIEGLERLGQTERLDLIEGGAILNAVSDLLAVRAAGASVPHELVVASLRGAQRHLGAVAISELHHKRYLFKADETPLDVERALLRAAVKLDEDLHNGETHNVRELSRATKHEVATVRRILCRWVDDGLAYIPSSAVDEEGEPFQLLEGAQVRLDDWDTYRGERAKAFTVALDLERPFPTNAVALARGIAIELGAHRSVDVHHASKGLLIQGTLPEDFDRDRTEQFTAELRTKFASVIAEERHHEPLAHAEREPRQARPSDVELRPAREPPAPLVIRREILEELYGLSVRSPQATGIWNAKQDDPASAARAREAEYLKERGLVSGTIGAHGDLALRLTANGRDYVEAGGFWSKAAQPDTEPPAEQHEHKLPRMEVTYGEKLGSGAFGTVWRATDVLLARDIAVKFLTSTDQAMDEDALIREARSLAKLAHPNLVTMYAAAWLRHPDTRLLAPALTMELLHGETLDKWWTRAHPRDEVLRVAIGLVAGVLATHAAGLVHGDIHAANVMVLTDATAKLIDWRYHDTFLQRSSSHRRDEIAAEERRVMDRLDTLFEKQGLDPERTAIRRMTDLAAVAAALEAQVATPRAATAASAPLSVGQQKLETALQSVRSPAVVLTGGVTEFAGNIRRDAVNGEIQLGPRDANGFQLRIPCGAGGIPVLTVPYELLRAAWVDVAGRLNVHLELAIVWNGRDLVFERGPTS